MAKIMLILIILITVSAVSLFVYEKIIHPFLFKEELEDSLEAASEEKIRRETNKIADEILSEEE